MLFYNDLKYYVEKLFSYIIMFYTNQMKYSIDSATSMATHETFVEYISAVVAGTRTTGIVTVKPIIMTMLQNSPRKTATDVRR